MGIRLTTCKRGHDMLKTREGVPPITRCGKCRIEYITSRRRYDMVIKNRYRKKLEAFGILGLDSSCNCCGEALKRAERRLDHDHATGKYRGTLCNKCNTGMGLLGDTIDGLRRALAYLEDHALESENTLKSM